MPSFDLARLTSRALWLTVPVNVFGGVVGALFPSVVLASAYGVEVPDPALLGIARIFYMLVAVLGIGFAVAARDPIRQSALVLVGGLGKLSTVGGWIALYLQGHGTPLVLGACAFDGTLGVLFLVAFVKLAPPGTGPASSAAVGRVV